MTTFVWDEYGLSALPVKERLAKCTEIIKTDKSAPKRWIAIYVTGEICYETHEHDKEIGDLMAWVCHNEKNDIVKHEACFQIGLRNLKDHIDVLLDVAVHHRGHEISRHEAIEALGLMRAHDSHDQIKRSLDGLTYSDSIAVKQSAQFVLELLELLKDKGEYKKGGKI